MPIQFRIEESKNFQIINLKNYLFINFSGKKYSLKSNDSLFDVQ